MIAAMTEQQVENLQPEPSVRTPKILCIDDDDNILRCFKRRFERCGIELLVASDGREGYHMAVETQPDVILTDLRMPSSNGCWVVSRLKANRRTVNIPVIVLTGQGDPDSKRIATFLGAEKYLEKPIPFRKLLKELRPYLTD